MPKTCIFSGFQRFSFLGYVYMCMQHYTKPARVHLHTKQFFTLKNRVASCMHHNAGEYGVLILHFFRHISQFHF